MCMSVPLPGFSSRRVRRRAFAIRLADRHLAKVANQRRIRLSFELNPKKSQPSRVFSHDAKTLTSHRYYRANAGERCGSRCSTNLVSSIMRMITKSLTAAQNDYRGPTRPRAPARALRASCNRAFWLSVQGRGRHPDGRIRHRHLCLRFRT